MNRSTTLSASDAVANVERKTTKRTDVYINGMRADWDELASIRIFLNPPPTNWNCPECGQSNSLAFTSCQYCNDQLGVTRDENGNKVRRSLV